MAARSTAPETIAANPVSTGSEAQKPLKIPEGGLAPLLPANGNPLVETRNRLVTELALGAAQAAKVDAIYAEARPRFAGLRDLQPAERGKARERISADIRARIAEVLGPEQKQRYAALQAQAVNRPVTRGRLYLLGPDGRPAAYTVRLGISDGSSTELLVNPNAPEAALLKEGATVITGLVSPAGASAPSGPSGPRLPF
ncbi:MAG: hypothetical protein FGM55_13565 [Rhodoferax sp.]|nr:hypothetical protein [Rhodoferax sp.]